MRAFGFVIAGVLCCGAATASAGPLVYSDVHGTQGVLIDAHHKPGHCGGPPWLRAIATGMNGVQTADMIATQADTVNVARPAGRSTAPILTITPVSMYAVQPGFATKPLLVVCTERAEV